MIFSDTKMISALSEVKRMEKRMVILSLVMIGLIALMLLINSGEEVTNYSVEDIRHFDAVRAERDRNR